MRFRQHGSFPVFQTAPVKSARSHNRLVGPGTEHQISDSTQAGGRQTPYIPRQHVGRGVRCPTE